MYQKILHIIWLTLLVGACNLPTTEQAISIFTPDISVIKTEAAGTVIAAAQTLAAHSKEANIGCQ